jgi:hypothetical protein
MIGQGGERLVPLVKYEPQPDNRARRKLNRHALAGKRRVALLVAEV